jgi:hypothetical protein
VVGAQLSNFIDLIGNDKAPSATAIEDNSNDIVPSGTTKEEDKDKVNGLDAFYTYSCL